MFFLATLAHLFAYMLFMQVADEVCNAAIKNLLILFQIMILQNTFTHV